MQPQYSIKPLVVGLNETDQGVMTYLRDYGKRIWLPIYVFYVRAGDLNVLVDTGLEDFVVPNGVAEELGLKIDYFEDALARLDLTPEDIHIIIHTHLHNDHCENDHLCSNAKVYVQARELEFFNAPHPLDHRYYPDVLEGVDVQTVDGDTTIIEGIDVVLTPGHSVGGQSVCVQTSQGKAVITGCCCNEKNFPTTGPAICPGVHIDATQAWESVQKIKSMADILIPLHDLSIGRQGVIPAPA